MVVDYFEDVFVPVGTFYKMARDFGKAALKREEELCLVQEGEFPPDWRTRIEAVLLKLEELAKKEV